MSVTVFRHLFVLAALAGPVGASARDPAAATACDHPATIPAGASAAKPPAGSAASGDLAPALTAADIPRLPADRFAHRPDLGEPQLAPDGRHLSVVLSDTRSGEHDLAIYAIQDGQLHLTKVLRMPRRQVPLGVFWSSASRLVIEKGKSDGPLDRPYSLGEIFSTDLDGRHSRYLYGYARDRSRYVGASSDQVDRGWGRVVGVHHPGDGHFTMAVTTWSRRLHTDIYEVNSLNGHRRLIDGVDIGRAGVLTDDLGRPVMAYGSDEALRQQVYIRRDAHWVRLDAGQTGTELQPLALAPAPGRVYAYSSARGEPRALVEQALDGSGRKVLARHPDIDIGPIEWSAPPRQPFAASLAAGRPAPRYLQPGLRDAGLYRQLAALYPELHVHFIDFSEDGRQLLFSLASDRQPPIYLLLDTASGKTHLLFYSLEGIVARQMAERRPRHFRLDDGMEVEAMLTLPAGYRKHPLPAVLLPHGGPFDVSDTWYYDADAQFLANRGYLVIQVNFRSSGGRGPRFAAAGTRHWGDRVQQDMIEVTRQLVAEGSVDGRRICTYGASFGGYSAMMSAIRAPDLFRCAIGYAGIYDLSMMYRKGDIRDTLQGRNYLQQAIGEDPAELAANSPVRLASQIRVPVLLIHGKDDQRAPFAQARALRSALEQAGHPPQWMAVADEGHGFYQSAHNLQRLQTIEAFLERAIGSGRAAGPQGAPSP